MPARTILIADDDRAFCEMLGTKLRGKGFDVVVAHDAMQAVRSAMDSVPDAIVMDVKMPGGTGLEAIRQLRISDKTSAIPVIAVSAVDNPQLPDVVRGFGATEFLPKPVHFKTVYSRLCSLLSLDPHGHRESAA